MSAASASPHHPLLSGPFPVLLPPGVEVVRIPLAEKEIVYALNLEIFQERRIMNSFDRDDVFMLIARINGVPAGFKVGYRESQTTFYSAKGGVLDTYRGRGLARFMLHAMINRCFHAGYRRYVFDTFPNRNPGMSILALRESFRLIRADFNAVYKDYRLRFEMRLSDLSDEPPHQR